MGQEVPLKELPSAELGQMLLGAVNDLEQPSDVAHMANFYIRVGSFSVGTEREPAVGMPLIHHPPIVSRCAGSVAR